jgi:hypothetical protein
MASWDLESVLEKAKEQEIKYGWLYAAWSYENALRLNPDDATFSAEIWQQIGFCYSETIRKQKRIFKTSIAGHKSLRRSRNALH